MRLLAIFTVISVISVIGLIDNVQASEPDLVIKYVDYDVHTCHTTDEGCFIYFPENAQVRLGGTVEFINHDQRTYWHVVTTCPPQDGNKLGGIQIKWCSTSSGYFSSPELRFNDTFTWTADKVGVIKFYDWMNSNMEGSFTVIDDSTPPVTPPVTPTITPPKTTDKDKKWKDRMQEFKEDLKVAFGTDNKTKAHLIQQAQICKVNADELSNLRTLTTEQQKKIDKLERESTELFASYNVISQEYNKLLDELANATKKIEELESKNLELENQNNQEQNNESEAQRVEPVNNQQTRQDSPTISITIPDSMEFDNTGRTIDLYGGIDNRLRIDTAYQDGGTAYHVNDKAYITMFRDTWITNKQFTASGGQYCYVGDLAVGQNAEISKQHTNTLNIQFRQSTDTARCGGSPDITLDDKLSLSKEIYIRFAGTDGQVPFYHTEDGTMDIPKCTNDNLGATNNLIGDAEICYGKNGSDTILVSKILAVFGV